MVCPSPTGCGSGPPATQGGFHEWVCFTFQQAAERAVKAVYQRLNAIAWGHAVSRLLNELPGEMVPHGGLIEAAIRLDRYYIPTRYPNGFERSSPQDYYTERDAREAIEYAERIRSSVTVYYLDGQATIRAPKQKAIKVRQANPDVLEISLFGSLAQEDHSPGSDADLYIPVEEDGQMPFDRIPRFLRLFLDSPIGTDVLVYTPTEVEKSGTTGTCCWLRSTKRKSYWRKSS